MPIRDFLTILNTFEDIETIRKTLPSVVEETLRCNAALVVHDCSVKNRTEIRAFIESFEQPDVFVISSSHLNQARARNLALKTGMDLFMPQYVASIEDDHGYQPGFIETMMKTIDQYYGESAPNGMRYGMFSGCANCWADYANFETLPDGNLSPRRDPTNPKQDRAHFGGVNTCCCVAPVRHWTSVLKGFDPDEYPLSYFQSGQILYRNYQNGFTGMTIAGGELMFDIDRVGRGDTLAEELRPFKNGVSKSDYEARQREQTLQDIRKEHVVADQQKSATPEEERSRAQLGQDIWVLNRLDHMREGFFVEIGATDGVWLSNTCFLERKYNWSGICVEPNPTYFEKLAENRRCHISHDCVARESGNKATFVLADHYGGLEEYAYEDEHADKRKQMRELTGTLDVVTISLNDLLEKYNAPAHINYISIDTEGSEFEILSGFDFSRWTVDCFTIEHNFGANREVINEILTAQGYRREPRKWDDFYTLLPN